MTDNKNFGSPGHSMDAGIMAGILMHLLPGTEGVLVHGDHSPFIDVRIPDDIPYPARVIRIWVEDRGQEYTLADMANAVMESGDPAAMKSFAGAVNEADDVLGEVEDHDELLR